MLRSARRYLVPFLMISAVALQSMASAAMAFGTTRNEEADTRAKIAERAQFVLSGMKSQYAALRSGSCRAQGRMLRRSGNHEQREWDVTFRIVLDENQHSFRIERNTIGVRKIINGKPEEYHDENAAVWIVTPTYTMYRALSESDLLIALPDKKLPKSISPMIDPRTISYSLFQNLSTPYDQMLHVLEHRCRKVVAADMDAEEMYSLRSDMGNDILFSMLCDGRRGYLPVRTEAWSGTNPGRKILDIETSYQQQADIWLPVSCRLVDTSGRLPNRLELSFEWSHVNEPVSAEMFGWKSLKLPPGTLVIDTRLGKANPVLVATVGQPEKAAVLKSPVSSSRRLVLIANGIAVFVLLLIVCYRRYRRRTS